MRILILGAGAIGGYYGGRLLDGGADVTFLVRTKRAALLCRNGLIVHSALGDVKADVHTEERPGRIYDLVVLACKATGLDAAIDAILPAIGPDTTVLPLLNGVRHLAMLDERIPQAAILGGLCHIGATMDDKGEIRHLNDLQRIALGARRPEQGRAAERVHAALSRGGIAPVLSTDIMQEMWEKFVFLTAYAGLTCMMRAPVGAIAATTHGKAVARELLEECAAIATASGYPPAAEFIESSFVTLSDERSEGAASMLRDVLQNRKTEQDHILADMLSRARSAGVSAPILRLASTHMEAYEALRAVHSD
ncbi:2-dehydropantoate 2-reductase [Pikeienuella piscinae]|uniref:2-dehydropantoate 2-reductase n=2 Tax=Pikeienuella piscinae TaxID=2748098 RepID=A0A7M3T748_9RHOB|nr:2-dehydropantoate 2-reductase [Pikeienuella piscinae]